MAKVKAKEDTNSYEHFLVQLMHDKKLTLSQALEKDFIANDVDQYSIFDMTEYLAEKFQANRDYDFEETQAKWSKVGYYMRVYTGELNDVGLKIYNENEAKKSPGS